MSSIALLVRLFEDGEFPEGVRALLVDKDRKPKWSPPHLAGVDAKLVEAIWHRYPQARSWASRLEERTMSGQTNDGPLVGMRVLDLAT